MDDQAILFRKEFVYAGSGLILVLGRGQAAETDRLQDYSQWPVLNVKSVGAVGDVVTDDSRAFATTLQRAGKFLRWSFTCRQVLTI